MSTSSKSGTEKATVIIPNWNGKQWLSGCLKALYEPHLIDFKAIIVDNGSTDNSVQFIKDYYPQVRVIELPCNIGFAKAVNIGIDKSTTPYIAILNNDTVVYKDWLSNLLCKLENSPPDIAAISPQMLSMDDSNLIDDAGDELSWYGIATKRGNREPASAYGTEAEIFSPSGGASLYRSEFLQKTGGFDPAFFAYLEDVDLGLRGRLLGYRYLYHPAAKVLHKSHGSGIQTAYHSKLITRNRLFLLAKNIPFSLLVKQAPKLMYGQLYTFIAYRNPLASLKGYWSFISNLPETMRKRGQLMKRMKIDKVEIRSIIHSRTPHPSLSHLLKRLCRDLFRKLRLLK